MCSPCVCVCVHEYSYARALKIQQQERKIIGVIFSPQRYFPLFLLVHIFGGVGILSKTQKKKKKKKKFYKVKSKGWCKVHRSIHTE